MTTINEFFEEWDDFFGGNSRKQEILDKIKNLEPTEVKTETFIKITKTYVVDGNYYSITSTEKVLDEKEELQKQLNAAIKEQNFELAVELRDKIKSLDD